jgi:hypothetical protein
MVLKLTSKNLSTTVFFFENFVVGKDEEGELFLPVVVECEEGCQKRRPYNLQSLPWGFLFYRSPENCIQTDRSVCLENSGTLIEGFRSD